jgi:hypothetical protein
MALSCAGHTLLAMTSNPTSRELAEKLIGIAALTCALELVFFKFVPDLGTAVIQNSVSDLTDFGRFEQDYLGAESVHHARFLGNITLYHLARWLSSLHQSADIRLHPLRLAAGILTPVYAYLGAHFALRDPANFAWRSFFALYALMVLVGQYVFYPADMPALAFLSMALFCLLHERLAAAFLLMLITGLYRETSFHLVWLVACWAWCSHSRALPVRLAWLGAFGFGFVSEYVLVRHFFPGPVSSVGGVVLDPRTLLLDNSMLSLTNLCSVGLAVLFPVACLLRVRAAPLTDWPAADWRRGFFTINAWVFPGWLLFYRMMNGNLAEFRMLFPVLLPCIYGIAYAAARSQSGTYRSNGSSVSVANRVS